jgi:hypothetical protein
MWNALFRPTIRRVLVVATTLSAGLLHAAGDPLARAEFDREMSLEVRDVDVTVVLRTLAEVTSVPIALEFDSDPTLKVSMNAKNMVARGILEALANTHGLEYRSDDEGLVVRRRGVPPAATRIVLGARTARAGPTSYWLDISVRAANAVPLTRTRMTVRQGVVDTFRMALGVQSVTVLDRERGVVEPRALGSIELAICVARETGASLDLIAELVVVRPLDGTRYTEEHLVASRAAASGESTLFKTRDGQEIVLNGWGRVAEK